MSGITITNLSVFTVRIPVKTIRRQGSGDISDKVGVVVVKIDTDAGMGDPIRIIEGRYRP